MIHSSNWKPKVFPYKGTANPTEIDRLQDMSGSVTINRTKIEEVGRSGIVDWRVGIPSVSLTLRQLEYGSIEFWNQLANKSLSNTDINLTDFKTSMVDIAGYKTDDDDTFKGTVWYPKFRLSGFGISIGDPDSLIERSFTLVGEDEIQWQGDNKYLIYLTKTCGSGESGDVSITIGSGDYSNYPAPVEDPDNSGTYILRVLRVRSGTTTELTSGSSSGQYEYSSSTQTLTFHGAQVDDVYKVYYTASSYITGESPFTANDSDLAGISADSCSIYLVSASNYIYRLQSVAIDVTLDRFDVKEIGNDEVVARGARDISVTVTLGRILETLTPEEALRGVSSSYGKIDIRKFSDDISLIVKIYSDADKGTFKIGYKFTDLAPTGLDAGVPLNDYITRGISLTGESGKITSDESSL